MKNITNIINRTTRKNKIKSIITKSITNARNKIFVAFITILATMPFLSGNVIYSFAYESVAIESDNAAQAKNNYKNTINRAGMTDRFKASIRDNFDAKYYAKNNADVIAAYGDEAEALFNHFIFFGIWEGRQMNAEFNVNAYASSYSDLRDAFSELTAAQQIIAYYQHYISYVLTGKENRPLTTLEKASASGITVVSISTDEAYNGTVLIQPIVFSVNDSRISFEDVIISIYNNYRNDLVNFASVYGKDSVCVRKWLDAEENAVSAEDRFKWVMGFEAATYDFPISDCISSQKAYEEYMNIVTIGEAVDKELCGMSLWDKADKYIEFNCYMKDYSAFEAKYIDQNNKYEVDRFNSDYSNWANTDITCIPKEYIQFYYQAEPQLEDYPTKEFADYMQAFYKEHSIYSYFGPYYNAYLSTK